MAINLSSNEAESVKNEGLLDVKGPSIIDKINDFLAKLSRVPLKDRLFFVQQLGVMLKAGISLSVGLKTLSKQTQNKYFLKILTEISNNVEKGGTFSESLKAYKQVFGEMFINMIEAGEMSGKLENVLNELYIQMKKDHALISKVKGALTYPAVVCAAMGGIGIFMMVFIIPKITSMFSEMNVELPLATRMLIKVSNALANHGIISLIIVVVFVYTLVKLLKTKRGKYVFDYIILNFPIISPIVKKINLARFSRNISSLLKTDIMIIKSFQITANVLGNVFYKKALEEMAQKIKKGGKISEVLAEYPKLFTPVVTQMVAIGEETGELDSILVELAEFYEEEVDQVMENLPAIIEPLLILLLGSATGGIAVAIIMPMYSLSSAV